MERVKGIEPSSLGWEPRALPLSYTRADENPIGEARIPEPEWYIPHGGRTITDPLAIGHPLEVSPLSRGAMVSTPIRAHYRLGIRFLQHPSPHTASRTLASPLVRTGIRISQRQNIAEQRR